MRPDARERRLDGGGDGLRFVDEGAGPPVVMLHGYALDLRQWTPQAAVLAEHYRVIRVDRPGFGGSGGTASIEADVRALARLVDELGLPRVALVASSQAGRAALRFALAQRARVAALVLDGVPLEGFVPRPRADEQRLREVAVTGGPEAVAGQLARQPFFRLRSPDPAAVALLRAMLMDFALRGPPVVAPPESELPMAACLAEIDLPALVVNGAFDSRHRLLVGEVLAYGLPRAERAVIAGAGHLANLDQPARYAERVRTFLDRHMRAAAAPLARPVAGARAP